MKGRLIIINLASLAAILSLLSGLAASILVFTGRLELDAYYLAFDLASLAWFVSSPFWLVPSLLGKGFEEAARHAWLRPKGGE